MPLEDLYNKIQALSEFDIAAETMDIIGENHELLTDLLKYEQLAKGLDGFGTDKILLRNGAPYPFYAEQTIKIKEESDLGGLGGVTDRITHVMGGEFYARIFLRTKGNEFEFDSEVPYFDEIIAHIYGGTKLMELSPVNLKYFSDNVLIPEIQKRFKDKFNGI